MNLRKYVFIKKKHPIRSKLIITSFFEDVEQKIRILHIEAT